MLACSVNLASMTRSRSFEIKLRLDIGLKELKSDLSMVAFLSNGRTTVDLRLCENVHCSMEALHILAMTGDNTSLTLLSSHVGSGSSVHCLAGAFRIIVDISAVVTDLKLASGH